jgi:cyclase
MALIRVIPILLLRNGGLVKSIKFADYKYVGDPLNAVKIFNEKEVDELIFLDITATLEGKKPNLVFLKEIASECFMPLTYGGGIKTADEIKDILKVGIEKVCINSAAVENPEMIKKSVDRYGSSSICVSIDVKKNFLGKYEIYTHSGTKNTKYDPVSFAIEMDKAGVGELIVNSIDADGTMNGYNAEIIKKITEKVNMQVVAAGGAGNLEHMFDVVKHGGASAVAAGSMFVFHGKMRAVLISYPSQDEIKNTFIS